LRRGPHRRLVGVDAGIALLERRPGIAEALAFGGRAGERHAGAEVVDDLSLPAGVGMARVEPDVGGDRNATSGMRTPAVSFPSSSTAETAVGYGAPNGWAG
jgi:hypothetical protein